jgi:hypothetical protein
MDLNHMKPFPLPDDSSASLTAELNEKQLTELTDLTWLTIPSRMPEIKQVVGTMFHTPAFKSIARATLQLSKKDDSAALVRPDYDRFLPHSFQFISH